MLDRVSPQQIASYSEDTAPFMGVNCRCRRRFGFLLYSCPPTDTLKDFFTIELGTCGWLYI